MKKPKTNKQLLVSAIRGAWMRSQVRRDALKAAKHPERTGWFVCSVCQQAREKVQIDHNPAVGGLEEDLSNVWEYVTGMFTHPQRGICVDCHKTKTKEDGRKRREFKRLNDKEKR